MTYRLDPATRINDGLRRVAFAELDLAHTALSAPPERHSGVHSSRKCLKRLRSLLLLARPGIPEPVFANLTDRIAGVARGLSAARDAQALGDAVDKLARETESGPGDGTIQSLRGFLQKRRHAAEQSLEQSAASEAMRALLELRPRFAGLAVYPDDFTPLAEGLKRCYRDARQAFRQSLATDCAEDVHEWRKGVQHHWRQMQLLAPCWPSELSARVEASRTLSQILGDDHDIALLTQLVATPTMTFGRPEEISAFLKRCRRRHKALRKQARAKAELLFVEKPRPFTERITSYWLSAAGKAESTATTERVDNVVAFGDLRNSRAS